MPAGTAEDATPDVAAAEAAAATQPWAVYLLTCHGGRSYIGISPRPQQRFEAHRQGRGAAFTRANRPQTLVTVVWFTDRRAAASMEARLKALPRPAKLQWFDEFPPTSAATPATIADGLASLARRRQPRGLSACAG